MYFSYFSMKTYDVGTHKKRLGKALLTSTTTYVFKEKYENINSFWLKTALSAVLEKWRHYENTPIQIY